MMPWFYLYLMLYIVANYYCMQIQGKLMYQTWENGKKTSFGTNFGLSLKFGPQNCFCAFYFY